MTDMSPHVKLALEAIEAYICRKETIEPPASVEQELSGQAGVFVSLKKFGELRGCIGTLEPTQPSIAHEIIQNAISSATRDPRFLPVTPDEISDLTCSVDVLDAPEVIGDRSVLDPNRYGVIVECGNRRGVLLPNLEGVDSVEEQIDIARQKANINRNEQMTLSRFEVKRFR